MTCKYKTGEWILFQKKSDSFYFIGLGLHNSEDKADQKRYEEIGKYLLSD